MAVITVHKGDLQYQIAQEISATHCFTSRFGGVSEGYLKSLNLGIHRGDTPENVLKNYEILGEAVGFSPRQTVLTKQTHTDIVRQVGKDDWGTGLFRPEFPPCDGLITNQPGTALVVFTADCTPVLLHDPVTGAVGAVHAGWRGTASGIAAKAVLAMMNAYGCRPEDICAAIGPNIGQCCFETDADVPNAMVEVFGDEAKAHIKEVGKKYYVNLKALNALHLQRLGVTNIAISTHCTACRCDQYWSHRKVGSMRGSQGAVIVCK